MKHFKTGLALAVSAMLTVNVLADSPAGGNRSDIYGDRLINLPMDESTVTSSSVEVQFLHIPGAYGYTVDLVGSGSAAQSLGCDANNAGGNPSDMVSNFRAVIQPSLAECGATSTFTSPGDGNGFGGIFAPSLHTCTYTLPILPDGNYALAINPLMIGQEPASGVASSIATFADSFQEVRRAGNCGPNDDDGNDGATFGGVGPGNPEIVGIGPYFSNALRDLAAPGDAEHDGNYQLFSVADATPPPVVAPTPANLQFPLWDSQFTGFFPVFIFEDESGDTGAANWYQLWVTDQNGARVNNFVQNPVGGGWFNLAVDTGEITCVVTNASGDRICTILATGSPQLNAAAAGGAGASPNDKWHWWIRSWNTNGYSAWSPMGQFIANP